MHRLLRGVFLLVILTSLLSQLAWSGLDTPLETEAQSIAEADELMEQFQFEASLMHLEEALQRFPASPHHYRKRGDVLMILSRNREALVSYRKALALAPNWVEGHWALWALLNRLSIAPDLELSSLFHIADLDVHNPLAQIRVARKLRELKRFEESVSYFRRAVEIDPSHLAYRLFLARGLFDIQATDAAQQEVQHVLDHASLGSPVYIAAQNLWQTVEGGTVDMGGLTDFFETTKQPYGEKGKDYKKWALTREQAWHAMKADNFPDAEATWRKVLTLDPEDDLAHYNLGLTLLKLERYEEAIASLQASFQKSKQPTFYPDAIFQLGQAFVKLKKWEQAIVYFERVLEMQDMREEDFYALNFPYLPKVKAALQEARTHVTNISSANTLVGAPPSKDRDLSKVEDRPLAISSPELFQTSPEKRQAPLRVLPLSVDVVRGWFRQLVTAKAIGRDESRAGSHEYIPLDPMDTFPDTQPRIYLVFILTTAPADVKQISTQWVTEQVEKGLPHTVMGTDSVLVDLNDNSGYFFLDRPERGWPVGTYRIDLFVGEEISPYTYVTDVRFRIKSIDPK